MTRYLRWDIEEFGTSADGRLFYGERGGDLSESVYGRVWQGARLLAFTPAVAASPLGRLLEELAGQYLDRRGGDRLRPEPVSAAWEWALRARRATTALMTGSAKTGYDVFDYLADALQRENTPETFVPESVPRAAADYADGPEAMTIRHNGPRPGTFRGSPPRMVRGNAMVHRPLWPGAPEHPDGGFQ